MAASIAAALPVARQGSFAEPAELAAAVGAKDLIILLDNCEHLIRGCAEVAECLLRGCPQVVILATSREPLGVPGEVIWRVPSLSFPAAGAAAPWPNWRASRRSSCSLTGPAMPGQGSS